MAKTPRLGRRERIARRLEKARRKANAQARPETEANSKDADLGLTLVGTKYGGVWKSDSRMLDNSNSVLSKDSLSRTHHTTCFRAGVSNLRDGKNVTYGSAKITVHVPGTVVGTKAKAAVKRNMARTLGIKQRYSQRVREENTNFLTNVKEKVIPAMTVPIVDKLTGEKHLVKVAPRVVLSGQIVGHWQRPPNDYDREVSRRVQLIGLIEMLEDVYLQAMK